MSFHETRGEFTDPIPDGNLSEVNRDIGVATELVGFVVGDAFDPIGWFGIGSSRKPIGQEAPTQPSVTRKEFVKLDQLFAVALAPRVS